MEKAATVWDMTFLASPKGLETGIQFLNCYRQFVP